MEIVLLQLKINNFYYEIKDYNSGDNIMYIEIVIKEFLKQWEKYRIRLSN